MHLYVKKGDDCGPLLCVHIGTSKQPVVKCACPVEAWNTIKTTFNSKLGKPEGRFAKLFGLSHLQVFEKLVVCTQRRERTSGSVLSETCSQQQAAAALDFVPHVLPHSSHLLESSVVCLNCLCHAGNGGSTVSHQPHRVSRAHSSPTTTSSRAHQAAAEEGISCCLPLARWCCTTGCTTAVHRCL